MTNRLRALMEKVDNMQEQMGNISREMETKSQKELLEIENTVKEIKHAFDGLIMRLDTAEERICELEDRSTETSKTDI